jgi:hypothetical protein
MSYFLQAALGSPDLLKGFVAHTARYVKGCGRAGCCSCWLCWQLATQEIRAKSLRRERLLAADAWRATDTR